MLAFFGRHIEFLRPALHPRFRWITLCFVLWVYRTVFMAASSGGFAEMLQIGTLVGMMMLVLQRWGGNVRRLTKTNAAPINSVMLFYGYALMSVAWAFLPAFAAFLVIQNFCFIALTFWLFSLCQTFRQMEKAFVYLVLSMSFLTAVMARAQSGWPIFIHLLQTGTTAAIALAYCFAEWLREQRDLQRLSFLRKCMVASGILLVTSTSSGANASCLAGVGTAMLLSGRFLWGCLIVGAGFGAWLFEDQLWDLLLIIMPGKTRTTVETATGRDRLWDDIKFFAAQRPWFGWGFACVERVVSERGNVLSPDAHNNYLGFYGSLGYVGCMLAAYHFLASLLYFWKYRVGRGLTGILCCTVVALMNGYSYGFLSGKGCVITISYFAMMTVSYHFVRIQQRRRLPVPNDMRKA